MRAYAVTSEQDPTIREIELAQPGPERREVVLRVLHSGVCHTDVHLRMGYYDLGSKGQMRLADRGFTYPLVLGHEIVGVVESIGADVRDVAVGDVRLVYPWIGCGECHRCLNGADNLCLRGRALGVNRPGGYAESVRVPDEKYLIDIDGLDPAAAATLACSGVTAMAAANKVLPLPATTPIVVIGAGGVGLTVIALLRALGHAAICAVDVNQANLDIALDVGASAAVTVGNGTAADVAAVVAATGGPVEAVIDLVNGSQTADLAFSALTKGGTLVQVGLFGGELLLPTAMMPLKAASLLGTFTGTLNELRDLVAIAKKGELRQPPIIPGVLSNDSVSESLDRLAAGGVPGRIVLSAIDAMETTPR